VLRRRITRNFLFKVTGETGSRVLGLVFYIFFARWFGAEKFGQYSFALSFASLFMALVDLGTNAIISRELARHRDRLRDYAHQTNALKILASLLTVSCIGISLIFLPQDGETKVLIFLMGFFVVGTGLVEYLGAVFSGVERMDMEATLKVLNKLLVLTGGTLAYYFTGDMPMTIIGLLLGYGGSLIIGYALLWRLGAPPLVKWNFAFQKDLIKQSFPLFSAWVLWNIYDNQDIVLLSFLGENSGQVGVFAAAARLVDTLRAIPVLMMGAIFPVLSDFWVKDRSRYRDLALFIMKWVTLLSLPIAVGTTVLSSSVIYLIYGIEYGEGGGVLAVAVWALMGIFANHVLINLFITSDRQKMTVVGAFFVTILNLMGNLILIPWFGIRGAAAALVLSESFYLFLNLYLLRDRIEVMTFQFLTFLLKPILACVVMAFTLQMLSSFHLIWLVVLGSAVYSLTLFGLKGIPLRLRT